jgi:hypothetical protein
MQDWIPPLLPVIGLAASVVLHIALVWMGIAGRHLGPLVVSALAYWVVVGVLASDWGSADASGVGWPLVVLSVLSSMALSYCYFTFVNLTATSLRIRLLRLLVNDPSLGKIPEKLLKGYSVADVVDVRMDRLSDWGHATRHADRLVLKKRPLFFWLGKMVNLMRAILGTSGR